MTETGPQWKRGSCGAWLLAALFALCAFTGCAGREAETEVLLVVDSDLVVGEELTALTVRIYDREGKAKLRERKLALTTDEEVARNGNRYLLPLSMSLVAPSQDSTLSFRVVVTGLGPVGTKTDQQVIEQQAIVGFRPGARGRLDMFLGGLCRGNLCRDGAELENRTCAPSDGQCGAIVEHTELPEAKSDGVMDFTLPAGVMRRDTDGGVDAAIDDAGPDDGGSIRSDGAFHCEPPAVSAPLSVSTSAGTGAGAVASYECESGYNLIGVASRICSADGRWSSTEPRCDLVVCGAPDQPVDSVVTTPKGTAFGETALYACVAGRSLEGDAERACLASGDWSGSPPKCTLVDCGSLQAPSHGELSTPGGTSYGAIAQYQCDPGYALSSGAERTCMEDGSWSGDAVSCEDMDACVDTATVCSADYPCVDELAPDLHYSCRGQYPEWNPVYAVLEDQGDGTAIQRDRSTARRPAQLQWQVSPDSTLRNFADARAYCASLDLSGGGWRIPSKAELEAIVDFGSHSIRAPLSTSGVQDSSFYWSSSPYVASSPGSRWALGTYMSMTAMTEDAQGSVRCVR